MVFLVLNWAHIRFVTGFQGLLLRSWRLMHFEHIATAFLRSHHVDYLVRRCVRPHSVIVEVAEVNPLVLGAALVEFIGCLVETQHLVSSP